MTIQLRDYQLQLVDDARSALHGCKRLLIQLVCGGGKTAIAAYMTKAALAKNNSVMFLCHRNELMMQASRTMTKFNIEHGLIAARYTPKPYCPIQISMIDTLRNRLDKVRIPTMLFIDEAHHAVSPTWKKIIAHYHQAGSIIIGLSATPERLDGRPLNDMFDDMVFGPTIQDLISSGYLSTYKYYAPPSVVDMEGIKKRFGDYDAKEQASRIDKPHVFGDAIEHYKKILYGKRAIAFQINIKSSEHFAAQCNEQGIPCLHVDGEMLPSERARAIKSFEDGHTWILSNVGLFGEGFDVSSCDGVILLRKTASFSLYLQMCGRAMRPNANKECAIILDHMSNVALHGLPDQIHEWTLDGKIKNSGKKKNEIVPIKQCPACYHVFTPAPFCPQCGQSMAFVARELENVEGELLEVTKQEIQLEKRREVNQARTLEDLEKIAEQRGYKKNWSKHIFEARAKKYGI